MIEAQPPQGEQPSSYLPAGPPDPLIFEDFEGMDPSTLRPGVDDKKGAWLDGFMPLAHRNLRTMYGIGPPLFVAGHGDRVVFFDFFNIGTTPYCLTIVSTGEIYATNTNTNTTVSIAPDGTITNPSRTVVGLTQYGSKYVLIVAQQPNGYFLWDGTTFYDSGMAVPGAGTMPTGIQGTAIEVYAGRVWIANNATITFSAPGSVTDFSTANGGGNFTSSDSFLRVLFVQLKQTNGFLYLIADSSVNYISGVQTSGSPPVTTFTNQNADPETGTPWPATVDVFSRNILFANAFGAHVSYGGAVTKISEPLDGVYNTVPNFGNVTPSAGKAIIFGKKCWILLLPIVDPVKGQQVNKLLLMREPVGKIWWASEQDVPLVYIQHQEINSVLTCYGSDGSSIYPLFSQPSVAFVKTAQTKLWDKPGGYQFTKFVTRLWGIVKYYSALSPTLNISLDNEINSVSLAATTTPNISTWVTTLGVISTWLTNSNAPSTWLAGGGTSYSILAPQAVAQQGVLTGFTVTTNAADMAVVSMMIQDTIAGERG
jgi:hypothetical protein